MQESNNATNVRKFKIGDHVKILGEEATETYFGIADPMYKDMHTVQTIDEDGEYADDGGYEINGYTWHEDDLELVSAYTEEKLYTQQDILDLIEQIAQEFDSEWNGDSDTYEESLVYNEVTEIIRSYKEKYQ